MIGNKELSSENSAGVSLRQRVAEKKLLKAMTRKEVGGWPEPGRKGIPGSVLSKHG